MAHNESDERDATPEEEVMIAEIIRLRQDNGKLRVALADAIRRPMGVVPQSAEGLVSAADLDLAEARRPAHPLP